MALTAVRLRQVDKRKNWGMKTYTSANSRTKYISGDARNPSPFRIVKSSRELAELQEFDQFEILEFDDDAHLKEFIQNEMEERARLGLPAVRAAVMTGAGAGRAVPAVAKPRKAVVDRLPAAASGPASDPSRTNTGRQPAAQETGGGQEEKPAPKKAKPKPKPPKKAPKKAPKGKKEKKAKAPRQRSTRPASEDE